MGGHVPEAKLIDVLEGGGAADRAHVEACAECAARLAEARAGLALAVEAQVPEPSPLYWDALRGRIREAVDREARPRRAFWGVSLRPVLAAAAVLAGLAMLLPRSTPGPSPAPQATLPAWSALPPAEDDPGLDVLRVVAPVVADAAPSAGCVGVGDCVVDLSDEESQALAESLRQALGGGQDL
jgi:hypothetical protein